MSYSITDYSDLYALIRHAAGDLGVYNDSGIRQGQYLYQDSVIDAAITYNLLKLKSNFSKVSGQSKIAPAMTDENDIGFLTNLVALDLVLSDTITAWRTRNLSIARDRNNQLAKILADLKMFSGSTGITLETDGALEHLYDEVNRTTDFISTNT